MNFEFYQGGKKSSAGSAKKKKGKKGSGKKGKKSGKTKSAKTPPVEVDIMSAPAMENLYYIAHASPDALVLRGFKWEGAPSGKKKKKGKKKK